MEYRTLGRTGIRVSEIGMGCEGFSGKTAAQVREMVDLMDSAGVNCIDLYTPEPKLLDNLGRALEGRREKFILQSHICAVWQNGQYKRTRDPDEARAGFADRLRLLRTGYADVGMIHYVDTVSDWNGVVEKGILDYALELKAAGTIKCVGLSSHSAEAALAAVETGKIDVLMFSVNPCYDLQPGEKSIEELGDPGSYDRPLVNMDPRRQALYETCQRLGVGITVMKAFGGGDLLKADMSPAGVSLTAVQCLHYALTRPGVASVLCGARSLEELRASIAYEDAAPEERDYAAAFAAMPKISWTGHCMYCGHCAPCSQGISVAGVTKFLNLCKAQGEIPETVREHYGALSHKAGECVQCGACEKRCPFGVAVTENMRQAAALFGA